jgi:hypothetical protein
MWEGAGRKGGDEREGSGGDGVGRVGSKYRMGRREGKRRSGEQREMTDI